MIQPFSFFTLAVCSNPLHLLGVYQIPVPARFGTIWFGPKLPIWTLLDPNLCPENRLMFIRINTIQKLKILNILTADQSHETSISGITGLNFEQNQN
jgi:hypothetical protein